MTISSTQASLLNPQTFAQRGVLVPFTGDKFKGSRIRRNGGGLEVLVPGFSGSEGVYVVDAAQIGDLLPLNLHDQALLAMIKRSSILNPMTVRVAALKVARSGIGGAEMKEWAEKRQAQDRIEQLVIFHRAMSVLLTADARLSKALAVPEDPAAVDPGTEAGKALTARIFAETGSLLRIDAGMLERRVRDIVVTLSPVFTTPDGHQGRLLKTFDRIRLFQQDLARIGEGSTVVASVLETTNRTFAAVEQAIRLLMDELSDLLTLLKTWTRRRGPIGAQIARVAWLLDGWETVCDIWEREKELDPEPESRKTVWALEALAPLIPLLPKSETGGRPDQDARPARLQGMRMVPAYHDWRTGVADAELLARLDTASKRTAASGSDEAAGRADEPGAIDTFLL